MIGEMAGRKREEKHRQDVREANQSQSQRRMRALVEFPADPNRQHLLANRRNEAPRQIQEELAIAKDRVGLVRGPKLGR
jgi:hypothetical protein